MSQWYLSYDGQQQGPMDLAQARGMASSNSNGFAWRPGFPEWLPISQINELTQSAPATMVAPPPQQMRSSHDIDFKIMGAEMQFVEVELDPGESAVAEAGAMMYKHPDVHMEAVFGDGSDQGGNGFMGKLMGAGKRLLTGESLFMTLFTHTGKGKAPRGLWSALPGQHHPRDSGQRGQFPDLPEGLLPLRRQGRLPGHLLPETHTHWPVPAVRVSSCKSSRATGWYSCTPAVPLSNARCRKARNCTWTPVAWWLSSTPLISTSSRPGNIKTALFGGEGLFFATLRGPGKIWLQSLPFSRLGRPHAPGRASTWRQQGRGLHPRRGWQPAGR